MGSTARRERAACVLGDADLVRALALAGVSSVLAVPPDSPLRHSRFVHGTIPWDGSDDEELLDGLVKYASAGNEAPVLYYQHDEHLLFVSRHRQVLSTLFRFVVADHAIVEQLVDKSAFHSLAEDHGLPVPRTSVVAADARVPAGLRFPCIIKPVCRADGAWRAVEPLRKAIRVDDGEQLRRLWAGLAAVGGDLIVQDLVPGPESAIESYHVYVDDGGDIAGEFTGRKIRTSPRHYGHTTALTITNEADVIELGRATVRAFRLSGVAKVDFKRDGSGALKLLEVNPRFTLWNHAGAVAGVNIPVLVWADLTGRPRPPAGPLRPGVQWCNPWDVKAARNCGIPPWRWLPWAARCPARSLLWWDDPLPILALAAERATTRVGGMVRGRREEGTSA